MKFFEIIIELFMCNSIKRLLLFSIVALCYGTVSLAQVDQFIINKGWEFKQADKNEWLSATVPGCVHTDLLDHKKIEDPYFGTNEKKVQWVDKKDWVYKTTFKVNDLNKQKQELVFEGLDTYADVYLNGEKILTADNMFRSWTIDVTKGLKKGENELKVYFHSPIKMATPLWDEVGYPLYAINDDSKTGNTGDRKLSVMTRKAGYHYGWDWGPRLVTSGIYRNIYLKSWNKVTVDNIRYQQKNVSEKNVDILTTVNLNVVENANVTIDVLDAKSGKKYASQEVKVSANDKLTTLKFNIKKPKLWWSNGLGEQNLYPIKLVVREGDKVLDENTQNIGIRTINLITEKDDIGESFKIRLNGIDVFMKGTNYIPGDMFLTEVSDEKMEETIKACADANMNMIRVWGGGTYEKDLFYDLCDKYGLIVWQDFMFACSLYPGDENFVANVKAEVKENVIRLRNHASVGMWCGNNEIEWAWFGWGIQKQMKWSEADSTKIINDYFRLFTEEIPNTLHEYDDKDYWASSPYFRKYGDHLETKGDRHLWDVWKGPKSWDYYKSHVPRFMSEYGYQSYPEVETMQKYVTKEDLSLWSPGMRNHQKAKYGNKRIMKNVTKEFAVDGNNFEKVVYASQLYQAYDLQFAIETHRRKMPHCMGSLYWQVNDCWPVASWASIDYEGKWKASHYAVRDAYKDVITSVSLDEAQFNVYIVSDLLKAEKAKLKVDVLNLNGQVVKSEMMDVTIDPNTSKMYYQFPLTELAIDKKELVVVTTLIQKGKKIDQNEFFAARNKDLTLSTDYQLEKKVIAQNDGSYVIELSTDKVLRGVKITSSVEYGTWTDNYFDLVPGETKKIVWQPTAPSTEKVEFSVQTLNKILKDQPAEVLSQL
ncbi:glycoside hydrolase family 2 protein [Flammeovirga aprica JL-4]|uniref:Beta-mannosidase B n=2 Tax=Flammeovirga aprica TaxID=29528 RepID=A0A7X9RYK9_9BACT|nr:glycoside hydrolase family 2 protein [Flammeovirga aprica JL-4]